MNKIIIRKSLASLLFFSTPIGVSESVSAVQTMREDLDCERHDRHMFSVANPQKANLEDIPASPFEMFIVSLLDAFDAVSVERASRQLNLIMNAGQNDKSWTSTKKRLNAREYPAVRGVPFHRLCEVNLVEFLEEYSAPFYKQYQLDGLCSWKLNAFSQYHDTRLFGALEERSKKEVLAATFIIGHRSKADLWKHALLLVNLCELQNPETIRSSAHRLITSDMDVKDIMVIYQQVRCSADPAGIKSAVNITHSLLVTMKWNIKKSSFYDNIPNLYKFVVGMGIEREGVFSAAKDLITQYVRKPSDAHAILKGVYVLKSDPKRVETAANLTSDIMMSMNENANFPCIFSHIATLGNSAESVCRDGTKLITKNLTSDCVGQILKAVFELGDKSAPLCSEVTLMDRERAYGGEVVAMLKLMDTLGEKREVTIKAVKLLRKKYNLSLFPIFEFVGTLGDERDAICNATSFVIKNMAAAEIVTVMKVVTQLGQNRDSVCLIVNDLMSMKLYPELHNPTVWAIYLLNTVGAFGDDCVVVYDLAKNFFPKCKEFTEIVEILKLVNELKPEDRETVCKEADSTCKDFKSIKKYLSSKSKDR